MFTTGLLNSLNKSKRSITYGSLIRQAKNFVLSQFDQNPYLETFPKNFENYFFLSNKKPDQTTLDKAIVYYHHGDRKWRIDFGAINGVSKSYGGDKLQLSVKGEQNERQTAFISKIEFNHSEIVFAPYSNIIKREQYSTIIPNLFQSDLKLSISLHNDNRIKIIENLMKEIGFIELVESEKSEFSLLKNGNIYNLNRASDGVSLFRFEAGDFTSLIEKLNQISKWNYFKNLKNTIGNLKGVELIFLQDGSLISSDPQKIKILIPSEALKAPLKIELSNNYSSGYFSAIYFSDDYEIYFNFLSLNGVYLKEKENLMFKDGNPIVLNIGEKVLSSNKRKESNFLKLIYSSTPFSLDKINNSNTSRGKKIATRGMDDDDWLVDWQTKLYEVELINPLYEPRKNHLLLIAIDEYKDFPKIQNSTKNAKQIKTALLNNFHFDQANIIELYNEEANGDNILDTLERFSRSLSNDDNLIIYFSGHGFYNTPNKRCYWIPADGNLNRRVTYINNSEITDFFTNLKCQHVLLLNDSVFMNLEQPNKVENPDDYKSRLVISSGRDRLKNEQERLHSDFFSYGIIKNLESGTNLFSASDLAKAVLEHLHKETRKQDFGMMFKSGHQGGEFLFKRSFKEKQEIVKEEKKSKPLKITLPKKKKERPRKKSIEQLTNHLLIIGIDEYSNGIQSLHNGVKDVVDFKNILLESYQFDQKNVTEIFNDRATKERIHSVFEYLESSLGENDNLVIYYSGHGTFDYVKREGYWIPSDANQGNFESFISLKIIQKFLLNTCKARHVFTIVDSCFSDSILDSKQNRYFKKGTGDYKKSSRWVLTSGAGEVEDGVNSNSPFSQTLLSYLRSKTEIGFWISDFCYHVFEQLPNNTKQIPLAEDIKFTKRMGEFAFKAKNIEVFPQINELIPLFKDYTLAEKIGIDSKGIEHKGDSSENKPKRRKNHLLLMGIDEYSNDIPKLRNAVNDSLALKKVLLDKYDFEKENVIELFNQKATGENVLNEFENLLEELTSDDNLLIYFSGHGVFNKKNKRGYWVPSDAKYNRKIIYINNVEITDFLLNTKAHHVFLIIDSCFSEALFMRSVNNDSAQRVDRYPSRWALSAGRLDPVSDGSMGKNSPFAKMLLKYLETETEDIVWANDICNFVIKNVAFNANQTPRGEALPGVGHMGGQFVFCRKGYWEEQEKQNEKFISTGTSVLVSKEEQKSNSEPELSEEPNNEVQSNTTFSKATNTPQDLEEWKDQIRYLIAKNNLDSLFKSLNGSFSRSNSKYNELILLRARYNSAKTDSQRGVITNEQKNMMFNQIRYALLELIDDMDVDDLKHFKIQRS